MKDTCKENIQIKTLGQGHVHGEGMVLLLWRDILKENDQRNQLHRSCRLCVCKKKELHVYLEIQGKTEKGFTFIAFFSFYHLTRIQKHYIQEK